MKHVTCALLAILLPVTSAAAAQSGSRSAYLTFPAGAMQLHAVFSAAQDLLQREYTIDKSLLDRRLEASVTYYDSVSAASSATAKSTLRWTLDFRDESDGRITVAITHTAVGHRPPESLVQFARNLAAAAKAPSAGTALRINGVTKPLADWKRS